MAIKSVPPVCPKYAQLLRLYSEARKYCHKLHRTINVGENEPELLLGSTQVLIMTNYTDIKTKTMKFPENYNKGLLSSLPWGNGRLL